VAIPFFKGKSKPSGTPARITSRNAPNPPTLELETLGAGGNGIIVEEAGGTPQSAVDEAAIFYATGQTKAAETMLKSMLATGERRAWHMLFDLYRVQRRERDFDQLALDYALRFETSPPVWQGMADAAPASSQVFTIALPPLLNSGAVEAMRAELSPAPKGVAVRLDFSRIEMVDEAGAGDCVKALEAARKAKRKLQVSGVDRLIKLLQDLNRATNNRPAHWLFLLELYQLLGRQAEFEDMAVEYAVNFEVSPPSWTAVQAAELVQAPPPAPKGDALNLSGEITPKNETALKQLALYAANHHDIVVDLSQVTRIDYACISDFISQFMQLLGSSKSVTLCGHNALIHELFRIMGIDQLVTLQPGKLV
jgi:anti-anti-sigma regulatory factor